ncbi:MAG TPA: DUF362 domain-containing protein [Candidatus Solibacter sp.]|nr:DUF362 domain-containing protein [Candidatus Solibacter sp.]
MPNLSRREWFIRTAQAGMPLLLARRLAADAPTAPVAVARCKTYNAAELLPTMQKMFDQLGGLGRLVKGKTVAIKINLTGAPTYRLGYLPLEDTHYTHPQVIAAAVHLMGKAGARRIRLLESPWSTADPVEEYILKANWEPRDMLSAAANVEFENTNYLGRAKKYSRMKVPFGGYIYPAFDLNHSYEDCDVFVSIAKMKEHATAGITLSMKNCFGLTPCTIYGTGAGKDEPTLIPKGGRGMVHAGDRQPSKSAPAEKDPSTPRLDTYRVPRTVVDLISARPIHLAIVEGIKTMTGGEGPWVAGDLRAVAPGVMVAGLNAMTTDAVCMAVMGFDPMADRGTAPFERCDSTLKLAEAAGVGTRDLKRIEVMGTPIAEARFDFAGMRIKRRALPQTRQGLRG